ncbi:hypothetical protein [Polaromonas sp. A23]|uniref:hypothetical protein n=1 Tax=Polaromonas sp. A23 TaxID=1944133 RepID=UPI001115A906|nr:hypothetical protein [Polaromonas sp. A23]
MDYSTTFWISTFAGINKQLPASALPGWNLTCTQEESYVATDLSLREGYDDLTQRVWLIGAPGAVGKSTLANEICAATGAAYLNLAEAATVAGNYMVGGLVRNSLWDQWTAGKTAVLIDALDEARLRATQSGFEDFLSDIALVARSGKFPVVVLGRVGIIEEAWMILNEKESINAPIFDIELFNVEQAENFVMARLVKLSKQKNFQEKFDYPDLAGSLSTHTTIYKQAITRIVVGLQSISAYDGNRFFGYAPVLDAVAKVVASQNNPARIGEEMQRILEGAVLNSLTSEILRRESGKLVTQVNSAVSIAKPELLYTPEEQLSRIARKLLHLNPPPLPSHLKQAEVSAYEQAVNNLLPQHPFLNGSGTAPSSAVFSACIVSAALKSNHVDLVRAAERYASTGQNTPNPFLYDFYKTPHNEEVGTEQSVAQVIPTEHIGLLFESVLAKASPRDTVRLSIEAEEAEDNLSVEIFVGRQDTTFSSIELKASSTGTIRLGRRVSGVSIDAESTTVEIGNGDQLELIAPVSISAGTLKLVCSQVIVKTDSHNTSENLVLLETQVLDADAALSAPSIRQPARLQVTWQGSDAYPWTNFASPSVPDEDPRTSDALRTLRRLVMAFRSHSKGRLARFQDKIEHARMLKGSIGEAVLRKLITDGVLTLEGSMYYLEPDRLGSIAGASFSDIKLKNYSPATRTYLQDLD